MHLLCGYLSIYSKLNYCLSDSYIPFVIFVITYSNQTTILCTFSYKDIILSEKADKNILFSNLKKCRYNINSRLGGLSVFIIILLIYWYLLIWWYWKNAKLNGILYKMYTRFNDNAKLKRSQNVGTKTAKIDLCTLGWRIWEMCIMPVIRHILDDNVFGLWDILAF